MAIYQISLKLIARSSEGFSISLLDRTLIAQHINEGKTIEEKM